MLLSKATQIDYKNRAVSKLDFDTALFIGVYRQGYN